MDKTLIYGIVVNGVFYSNHTTITVNNVDNGLYSIDITADDVLTSIEPADLFELEKFVRKSNKMFFLHGYSFHDGIIPMNPIKYPTVPIKVLGSIANEWEYIKVLSIPDKGIYYFFDISPNSLQEKLFNVKDCFDKSIPLKDIKHITSEMRILYNFHSFEKIKKELELKKLKELEYKKTAEGYLKTIIEESGGKLISFIERNGRGYEVTWSAERETINTMVDYNFRVIEGGFCMSGYDKTQSMSSVVKVLKDYKEDGSHIHKTRTVR